MFSTFWELRSHAHAPTGVKFCMTKQTHMLLGCANADFQPLNKFNTGSLPLCGKSSQ